MQRDPKTKAKQESRKPKIGERETNVIERDRDTERENKGTGTDTELLRCGQRSRTTGEEQRHGDVHGK